MTEKYKYMLGTLLQYSVHNFLKILVVVVVCEVGTHIHLFAHHNFIVIFFGIEHNFLKRIIPYTSIVQLVFMESIYLPTMKIMGRDLKKQNEYQSYFFKYLGRVKKVFNNMFKRTNILSFNCNIFASSMCHIQSRSQPLIRVERDRFLPKTFRRLFQYL